jgi:WD40 repeat protein
VNKPQQRDACLMTLAGYSEPVLACAYSPDGLRMVTASRDRTLKIWDAKTGTEIATLTGHTYVPPPLPPRVTSIVLDCRDSCFFQELGGGVCLVAGHADDRLGLLGRHAEALGRGPRR